MLERSGNPALAGKEEIVNEIRGRRWRLAESLKLHNISETKEFIDDLGILAVFSDKVLPNLYEATYSAEEPRADGWNWDKIDRAWQIALTLTREKQIYYGKLIRKKNLLISMKLFASFYRLWCGSDYLDEYYSGHLSKTGKDIMDVFTKYKVLSTHQIRSYVLLRGKEGTKALHRALVELQAKGMLTCVGSIRKATSSWDTFLWGIPEDWIPEDIKIEAENIEREKAMSNIIKKFVYTLVITDELTITRFFKWEHNQVNELTEQLIKEDILRAIEFRNHKCLTTEAL